jgi:hypothetical protein
MKASTDSCESKADSDETADEASEGLPKGANKAIACAEHRSKNKRKKESFERHVANGGHYGMK